MKSKINQLQQKVHEFNKTVENLPYMKNNATKLTDIEKQIIAIQDDISKLQAKQDGQNQTNAGASIYSPAVAAVTSCLAVNAAVLLTVINSSVGF